MNRKRILLADDDSSVRQIVALTLGQEHFLILQARNGREAIELARSRRPDLVLLDISMPDMDGLEVCRVLKAEPSTASAVVIILTGSSSRRDEQEALEAGADRFFSKPFSPLLLLNTVYEAMERHGSPAL